MIFSIIRYIAAIYALALESLYPFDSLPLDISISDEAKESLKFQAQTASYWSAIVSMSFISMFAYFLIIFSLAHGMLRLAMYYRPALREKVDKRMAKRALKAQNKKRPSKRAVWGSIAFNLLFSVLMIVNDVVFNRSSEDAASLKDSLLQDALLVIQAQTVVLLYLFALGCIFSFVRRIWRLRRQQRTIVDEESRLIFSDMVEAPAEVEGQKGFVLEEKLIDFSDGMHNMYEKMETYAAPDDKHVTESEEDSLIRL